ncbi:MAG TPA: asparagine synthase-related protein, partial [Actinomycetota bacterium]
MSAICGVIGTDGRPWSVADLDGVAHVQAPLGPDGKGQWEGAAGRCGVAIAVALRHATPEDAAERQPARNAGESTVLVGDLRIDNRAELAGTLGLTDDASAPDSVFALRSYERWGESMFDRIVGEFALAIVDRSRGGVLLARDHVGARPLAICERREMVAFASMPLALGALEDVGYELDSRHAAEILAVAYASDRTFLKGVRWLPAGGAAWIDAGGVRFRRWWDPDPHETTDASRSEHARALRESFDLAVAARLRSAGRVGASVSGGLDSTSVAATAARLVAPQRLSTFTAAPPPGWSGRERAGWDADESALVRELASMHDNMAPTFVHVPADVHFFEMHVALWELGAGPLANPANALWMHALRQTASEAGVTALMTGDFGNLFFSADGPQWLVASLRAG